MGCGWNDRGGEGGGWWCWYGCDGGKDRDDEGCEDSDGGEGGGGEGDGDCGGGDGDGDGSRGKGGECGYCEN